ncbi:hypothetical protein N7532_000302 [Penicillium argentinense]|uniref:Serine hydrolase domain-containing protein n=1 Tax=Penicillium argentinense TaxID=1131581 RepID=A0A9W9G591_9EURO|nr:uncharacterized protein N7532_000302 [Penicillium argentinense]KAJ5112257.1 hypothetical protein N7532_000302 [Penicillium argentinense]
MTSNEPCATVPSCVKILMLHGHGQSGQFFRCKTQFMHQAIRQVVLKALQENPRRGQVDTVEFHYPSGILPANPDHPRGESNDMWAWGNGDPELDIIRGLEQSIQYIFRLLEQHGPFIGVMGFSTGAALAAIIASLLEKEKPVYGFQFDTFHPPLEFVISFSGFKLENPDYKHIYSPKIKTPILHIIGTLDTMVSTSQSLRLRKSCANASLHSFHGTHYVPRTRHFLKALAQFVEETLGSEGYNEGDWEDCDED